METAQPQVAETPVPTTFDPLDEASVKSYAEANAKNSSEMQSTLSSLNAKLDAIAQKEHSEKMTADINSAVDSVAKQTGIDKRDYIEFKLEKLAAENEGFKNIWDNRNQNPKALEKALEAYSHEMKNDLEFTADPQLAENHRAANQSQQSSATDSSPTYNNAAEEALAGANTEAERQVIWQKIKSGG